MTEQQQTKDVLQFAIILNVLFSILSWLALTLYLVSLLMKKAGKV